MIKKLVRLSLGILLLLQTICVFGFVQTQPLPVDKAFSFSAAVLAPSTLVLRFEIAPGYHLYKNRFNFFVKDVPDQALRPSDWPAPSFKTDPELGVYPVYSRFLELKLPLEQLGAAQNTVTVQYQGCAKSGFCYPPQRKNIQLDLGNKTAFLIDEKPLPVLGPKATSLADMRYHFDSVLQMLLNQSIAWGLLLFFGLGVLLSLTPCVLPMVPILSGLILRQRARHPLSTSKAFTLSLMYVLGMSLTYALAGVAAAALGYSLQSVLQKPWILGIFSTVFVLLALSCFGWYELRLPEKWQSGMQKKPASKKSSYAQLFGMGALSSVIVSPCVTAPLLGALAYIAQTGKLWMGATHLFVMGLGMGLPLLLVGTLGNKSLPQAGPWMLKIKHLIGIGLLAVALDLIQRFVPESFATLLWALLCFSTAVLLGIFETRESKFHAYFWRGMALIFLGLGILTATSLFQRLYQGNGFHHSASSGSKQALMVGDLTFVSVDSLEDIQRELRFAAQETEYLMLDFYADWCVSCKNIEKHTLTDPEVQKILGKFRLLRLDMTQTNAEHQRVLSYFGVIAPPTLIFFAPNQQEIPLSRITGEISAKNFVAHLKKLISSQKGFDQK